MSDGALRQQAWHFVVEDLVVGFNVAVLAYSDELTRLDLRNPIDDCARADAMVEALFPRTPYVENGHVNLMYGGFPERGLLNVASFEGGDLVATRDAHLYNPSKLHHRYLKAARGRTVLLLTQRSFNDMFAFARWENGQLIRSISVNPVGGVWEDIGPPEKFEVPFWRGDHAVEGAYPLPFHPLEFSGVFLRSVLGLLYEGPPNPALTFPDEVRLRAYTPRRVSGSDRA